MPLYPPLTPQGALGSMLSALIVVLSAAGLTLHDDFYAGKCRRDYWAYYTNLSNLLVFIYFALLGPMLYAYDALRPLIPHTEYALMLCIMLTHAVYHHLLAPFIGEDTVYAPHLQGNRLTQADSLLEHYAVPLTTFVYWLFCSPGKAALGAADAVCWLIVPLGYVIFVFCRARVRGCIHAARSAYPYPFLDIGVFGVRRVLTYCAFLLLLLSAAGCIGVLAVHAALTLKTLLF